MERVWKFFLENKKGGGGRKEKLGVSLSRNVGLLYYIEEFFEISHDAA